MRTANIGHSADGWQLTVRDEPWWAIAWEHFYDWALTALGSPCCQFRHGSKTARSWAGWLYDHLPDDLEKENGWRGRFQVAQFRLLNNRLTNRVHGTDILKLPITTTLARKMNAEFVADNQWLEDERLAEAAKRTTTVILGDVRTISTANTATFTITNAPLGGPGE